jgi:D-alanine-D-alanine ligase
MKKQTQASNVQSSDVAGAKKKVGVLMGGIGPEREISLKTGEAIATALEGRGHQVVRIDVDRKLDETLRKTPIDVAFLALHGRVRRGRLRPGPARADWASPTRARACSRARSRWTSSRPRSCSGSTTCRRRRTTSSSRGRSRRARGDARELRLPGLREAASLGLERRRRSRDEHGRARAAHRRRREATTPRSSSSASSIGREVTVGILDGRALGAIEIVPKRRVLRLQEQVPEGAERLLHARAPGAHPLPGGAQPRGARAQGARLPRLHPRRSPRDRGRERVRARGQHAARA